MANIPLQSISFPGLSDKYTTPVVDNTLTQAGAAADAKKTGDEIGAIKNDLSDGTMTVNKAENADQLTSTVGIEDTAPYLFRTSGGSNDIGDREDVKKVVGVSVPWNQQIQNGDFASVSIWSAWQGTYSVSNNEATITISTGNTSIYQDIPTSAGHKVLALATLKKGTGLRTLFILSGTVYDNVTSESYQSCAHVIQANGSTVRMQITVDGESGNTGYAKACMVTDLTLVLGTSIADYVYSLEQATAGAGVAWLKKHFPAQFDAGYQAYDAGSLQSVSGLTEHKMVGFNQFDADSAFEGATGITKSGNSFTGNANAFTAFTAQNGWEKIKYISGQTYYGMAHITLPNSDLNWAGVAWVYTDGTKTVGNQVFNNSSGVSYVLSNPNKTIDHFSITYGSNGDNPMTVKDICINLHWDGERDGEYEPYVEYTYPLDDSVTLRGIPKLDSANNLYYDGDTYESDGTVTRRYNYLEYDGSSDENWILQSINSSGIANFSISIPDYDTTPTSNFNNISNRLGRQTTPISNTTTEGYMLAGGGTLYIRIASTKADTVAAFRTWLASNPTAFVYMLATPTTETALPYQETQIVDDFGTEEFVLADGVFPVPVGHNTMYQNNLRAKLEMSPDSPDGDGLYVVQQESGENTYVPLASTATIQDILARLTALENA